MTITAVTPHIMWGGDAGGFQFSSTLWGRGAGRNWLFVKSSQPPVAELDEGPFAVARVPRPRLQPERPSHA